MNASPLLVILAILLILVGLTYPFFVLWRLNKQLSGQEAPVNHQLIVTIVLAALVPLTCVLAGFWLVAPQARGSLVYTGALLASVLMLLVAVVVGRRRGKSSGA